MPDVIELSVINTPLPPALRRQIFFSRLGIDLVIDVGANAGQYASRLREAGFDGDILSFEPVLEAFTKLDHTAAQDPRWTCRNVALGASPHVADMRITRDTRTSSLLPSAGRDFAGLEAIETTATRQVAVETLDREAGGLLDDRHLYLKIDVEGSERAVLDGAQTCLKQARAVELELSLVALWAGAHTFGDMVAYMDECGFRIASAEPVTEDLRSGEMLQVDAVFVRHDG